MAVITPQNIVVEGLEPAYVEIESGGDQFVNHGVEFIHIKNGVGGPLTGTISTGLTADGLALADLPFTIPAGEERIIGPFPRDVYNDASNNITITYT